MNEAMQETMSKFRAKGAFVEKMQFQLTRIDPTREADYKAENKALLARCSTVLEIRARCGTAPLYMRMQATLSCLE